MRAINIHGLQLQFIANSQTRGKAEKQAEQALHLVEDLISSQLPGLGASLIGYRDEIEVKSVQVEEPKPRKIDLQFPQRIQALQSAMRILESEYLSTVTLEKASSNTWQVIVNIKKSRSKDVILFDKQDEAIAFVNLVENICKQVRAPLFLKNL